VRLLVKIGGAQLGDPASRGALARAIAAARADGHQVILVHGGGDQIRELTSRLGIADRYHDGLRITDAATAEVVLMVLGGQVNRRLVHDLGRHGTRAVGITGADGGSFFAAPLEREGVDLGFVGQVHAPDRALVECLLEQDLVPVIATVAPLHPDLPGDPRHFYNINADHCAGPLADAFAADQVLFLTNVAGVLDAAGARLASLTPDDCARLRAAGVITGGMIPKVEAALMALAAHPDGQIKIAPAAGDDAVRGALAPEVGTLFRLR
jgi:acetylglutamate kinase